MWQSVCSNYCPQLNAVSFSTTLHAALYRSIYSLLTWSYLGTLLGFLVCYCECGNPSVPVTAVNWMLSVSTQTVHAALYISIYSLLTWSYLGTLLGYLGVFAKFWRANISFDISYCSFYRPYGTTRLFRRRISMKFYIWVFFEHIFGTFEFSSKSDQNYGYFTWRPTKIFMASHSALSRIREFSNKRCIEIQNKYIVLKMLFFPKIMSSGGSMPWRRKWEKRSKLRKKYEDT